MITAIDTSVLIAIAKGEVRAREWTDVLAEAHAHGDLMVCDVVAAEYYALVVDRGQPLGAQFRVNTATEGSQGLVFKLGSHDAVTVLRSAGASRGKLGCPPCSVDASGPSDSTP